MNPEQIDQWLIQNGHDRPWLAKQLGMAKASIYNSFSKGFSARTLAAIDKLINPPPSAQDGLEVAFSASEFERIERARNLLGLPTRKQYYEEAIIEYTNGILAREAGDKSTAAQKISHFPGTPPSSHAAEDSAHYDSSAGKKKQKDKTGTED